MIAVRAGTILIDELLCDPSKLGVNNNQVIVTPIQAVQVKTVGSAVTTRKVCVEQNIVIQAVRGNGVKMCIRDSYTPPSRPNGKSYCRCCPTYELRSSGG